MSGNSPAVFTALSSFQRMFDPGAIVEAAVGWLVRRCGGAREPFVWKTLS